MLTQEIYERIIQKKEFSHLPKKDVIIAFSKFEKRQVSDEEKIRLTRDLLRKVFSAFVSEKILSIKDKNEDWILRKHLSTRERLPYYKKLYSHIFKDLKKDENLVIFDLGAGVNGFSYKYLKRIKPMKYFAVEAIGQLVDLMNHYFEKKSFKNALAIHESLFEINKIKHLIAKENGKKIVFLFKTLDSLEMLDKDYSKRFLKEIANLTTFIIVSFATRSMIKRTKFQVKRNWIINFIKENFDLIDDFEMGGERYILFMDKK